MIELMMANSGDKTITTNGIVFRTAKEAHLYMGVSTPQTPKDVFDTWPRIDGRTFLTSDAIKTGSANNWQYITTSQSFLQPDNTAGPQSIVSPFKVTKYVLDVTLTSTNGDDDRIGIVAAANEVGGKSHYISVVVNAGGKNNGHNLFSMRLHSHDETANSIGVELVGNEIITPHTNSQGGDGWSSKRINVQVVRDGNIIKAKCSDWDSATLLPASELVVDLNTISGAEYLNGPARYGYYTQSQANSTYHNIVFSSPQVTTSSDVYIEQNNQKWSYGFSSSGWDLRSNTAYYDFRTVDLVKNPLTKEEYEVKTSTLGFKRNNGISYGITDINVEPYHTTEIPDTAVLSNYSYNQPLTINSMVGVVGGSAVSSLNEISIRTGFTDIHSYAYLNGPIIINQDTGESETTIGFRKVNFKIYPTKLAQMFQTDRDMNMFTANNSPPSPTEIFNTWGRSDDNNYYANPSYAVGDSAEWYFQPSTNTFVQPMNAINYQIIHSPNKFTQYSLETTLASGNPDGDLIGVAAASVYTDNTVYALVFIVQTGGRKHMPAFSATLLDQYTYHTQHFLYATTITGNEFLPQDPIATTAANDNPNYGWWNRQVKIRVERNGNIVTAVVSNWNSSTLQEASRLTVDLSTLPGKAKMLAAPSSYGYFSHSQADSKYLNINFQSNELPEQGVVYSNESKTKKVYDGTRWNTSTGFMNDFTGKQFIVNERTKEVYKITGNTVNIERAHGITGSIPAQTASASETTKIPTSALVAGLNYHVPVHVHAIGNIEGVNAVFNITTIDVLPNSSSGTFDVYVVSDYFTDPHTGRRTNTVGVFKAHINIV